MEPLDFNIGLDYMYGKLECLSIKCKHDPTLKFIHEICLQNKLFIKDQSYRDYLGCLFVKHEKKYTSICNSKTCVIKRIHNHIPCIKSELKKIKNKKNNYQTTCYDIWNYFSYNFDKKIFLYLLNLHFPNNSNDIFIERLSFEGLRYFYKYNLIELNFINFRLSRRVVQKQIYLYFISTNRKFIFEI
jgi:hypothetical protein